MCGVAVGRCHHPLTADRDALLRRLDRDLLLAHARHVGHEHDLVAFVAQVDGRPVVGGKTETRERCIEVAEDLVHATKQAAHLSKGVTAGYEWSQHGFFSFQVVVAECFHSKNSWQAASARAAAPETIRTRTGRDGRGTATAGPTRPRSSCARAPRSPLVARRGPARERSHRRRTRTIW